MRVIAGVAGGRRFAVPPRGTRPTSDRVREALFSALEHDPGLDGAAVLDLCAGSGALGLEALSRGAAHALFVESDRRAAGVLRRNVAELGLRGRVRVGVGGDGAGRAGGAGVRVLIVDPPYPVPDDEVAGWLTAAAAGGWLAAGAVVVVERSARDPFPWPRTERARRRYGDTSCTPDGPRGSRPARRGRRRAGGRSRPAFR